jgi:hypothetical protein
VANDVGEFIGVDEATIGRLDRGRVGIAIRDFIRQAVNDCLDRPGDDRARVIKLEFALKPVAETHGEHVSCEGAKGVAKVKLKLPDRESSTLDFGVRKGGHLLYNENSPSNHRQATLFAGDEEES